MTFTELFNEVFTMTTEEDFENFVHNLFDSNLITQDEYDDLWDVACDICSRYIA